MTPEARKKLEELAANHASQWEGRHNEPAESIIAEQSYLAGAQAAWELATGPNLAKCLHLDIGRIRKGHSGNYAKFCKSCKETLA